MKRPKDTGGAPAPGEYASTAQVSRMLGVGVTTVKRWVDDGILPAVVSPGGHRKLLLADVLRSVRDGKLPRADGAALAGAEAPAASDLVDLGELLLGAIGRDDADAIRELIVGAADRGHPIAELADRLIAPALRTVGCDWEHGILSVMREHRITQAFIAALYQLNARMRPKPDPKRPVALGGAPEHDHYILPTLLATMTLLETGWTAVNIGPHTPFTALLTAVDELQPKLVWVSVSHLADPERFVLEYGDFCRTLVARGIAVTLGGQALTPELRVRLPHKTFGDGCVQLAAFAEALHARKRTPKRGRPTGSGKKPG